MKNYEKLKEIIQQANPEIMELKFGNAFIEEDTRTGYHIVSTDFFIKSDIPFNVIARKEGTQNFEHFASEWIEENCKILGRPIRLADVILADRASLNAKLHEMEIADMWDLTNDNLDAQSDQTKQSLMDLLC